MARDVSDTVRDALGNVVREALKNAGDVTPSKKKSGPLSGTKGIAAGMGLAAAAPLAKKGVGAIRSKNGGPGPEQARRRCRIEGGRQLSETLKETVSSKVDEAGGAGGLVKEAASGLLPGRGGDSGGGKGGMPASARAGACRSSSRSTWPCRSRPPTTSSRSSRTGRRSCTASRASRQDDDCTVKFATKIWS